MLIPGLGAPCSNEIVNVVIKHCREHFQDYKARRHQAQHVKMFDWSHLRGKKGIIPYNLTRQICYILIRRNNKKETLQGIGNLFGGRDHATIFHGLKTINNLIETDKKIRSLIWNIEEELLALDLINTRIIKGK